MKHEHIAAAHLRQLPGVEVLNPQLRMLRATRRGPVWCVESLFPNYLFARFVLPVMLEKVRYAPSVKAVLQFGDRIPVVPDSVIRELRRDLEHLKPQVLVEAPEEGEEVEVATGPFRGLSGPVLRVHPARQRVQILLEVMGRSISAEVSLGMILFRRREAASFVLGEAVPS